MRRLSAARRTFRLLAAALQLTLPGAVAWTDARLDVVATHAMAHIESHTTDSCARIHPPDCALCHFLTMPLAPRQPAALRLDGAGTKTPHRIELARLPRPLAQAHPHSRAPPPLS